MRIYLAIPKSGSVLLQTNSVWRTHFYRTLARMGHDVVVCPVDFDSLLREMTVDERARVREEASEAIVRHVEACHREKSIELFLGYLYSSCITASAVRRIRDLGIVTVNFSCNNVHQFYTVEEIAPEFDFCMVPERSALEKFRAVGAHPIHVAMAANPEVFKRIDGPKVCEVSFVGTKYADRGRFIYALLRRGLQPRVWGPGWTRESVPALWQKGSQAWRLGGIRRVSRGLWERVRHARQDFALHAIASPGVDEYEMVRIFNGSKITLNFAKVPDPDHQGQWLKHVRLRDFEAPMTGVFYLAEYVDELAEYYEVGKEIVCFQTAEELVDKAAYYLKHDSEREKIREAGYKRALGSHTWESRFERLFREIGLS